MSPTGNVRADVTVKAPRVSTGMEGKRKAEFTFINLSEPKQSKDRDVKKIVRSNAMRTYHQMTKQKAIQERAQKAQFVNSEDWESPSLVLAAGEHSDWPIEHEAAQLEVHASTPANSQVLRLWPLEDPYHSLGVPCDHADCNDGRCKGLLAGQASGADPQAHIGNCKTDPFNMFPFDCNPHYLSYVLNHFVTVMARRYCPIDPSNGPDPLTKVWIPYAMTEPALFLSTLNFAATHLDCLRGHTDNPQILAHKVETIRQINSRLERPTKALADETIGAVVMLAAMENLNGNHEELQVHMKALTKMVMLRGGLENLGWKGALHMFIVWQDLLSSSISASPHAETLINEPPAPDSMVEMRPDLDIPNELAMEITPLFEDIRSLVVRPKSRNDPNITPDTTSFSSACSAIEHRLQMVRIRKSAAQMTLVDYQMEASRLTALIFLKCACYGFGRFCDIAKDFKQQFMDLVTGAENRGFGIIDLQLRRGLPTWSVFVGGGRSLDVEEEDWYAIRIARSTIRDGGIGIGLRWRIGGGDSGEMWRII